jgi:hypothetical protein
MNFSIIRDTREKEGWPFDFYPECNGMVKQKLDEGDYTIKELWDREQETGEKILRIERKRSTSEIANNLGLKSKQFYAELNRLTEYEYAYLILEFSQTDVVDFPERSGIPKRAWSKLQMNGNYMLSQLETFRDKFGVEIIYAGDKHEAEAEAMKIFRTVYELKTQG